MKKGFTLIELLAVIVILAIIALIATPIVLNIINDTKESATLRSAEFYLDAVEYTIANQILNGNSIQSGTYKIEAGDICLDNACTQKVGVEVKGEKPTSGEITIQGGQIENIVLVMNDKPITKNEEGKLVYIDTNQKYTIGQQVRFNPGDGDRLWNVIAEDATTVTLMLTENLGNRVTWYSNAQDNSYGPQTALNYLNSLTTEWDNVDPIKNYTYINNLNGAKPYGYQQLEIRNGKTTLTHKDGTTVTEIEETTKARLLTVEEVYEIAQKTNKNLTEENLVAFISDNLVAANNILQSDGMETPLETVDDMIEFVVQMEITSSEVSKYLQTYFTVGFMAYELEINPTYDILLPDYLYQNLYSDKSPNKYWTLSSNAGNSFNTWNVNYDGDLNSTSVDYDPVDVSYGIGIRPVITISKSTPLENAER